LNEKKTEIKKKEPEDTDGSQKSGVSASVLEAEVESIQLENQVNVAKLEELEKLEKLISVSEERVAEKMTQKQEEKRKK
jgi:hypothetical protein